MPKTIVINNEVNDTLNKYFKGEIDLINQKKIEKLFDEGKIELKMKKFLKKLKIEFNKNKTNSSEYKIVYKIKGTKKEKKENNKIIIDDELQGLLTIHFDNEISKIKPTKLKELQDENLISEDTYNILKKLKQLHSKYKGDLKDHVEYKLTGLDLSEMDKIESDVPTFFDDLNPTYAPGSPTYAPGSPTYAPGSPTYAPGSPGSGEVTSTHDILHDDTDEAANSSTLFEYFSKRDLQWKENNNITYADIPMNELFQTNTLVKIDEKLYGIYNFDELSPDEDIPSLRNLYDINTKIIGKIIIDIDEIGFPPIEITEYEEIPIVDEKYVNLEDSDITTQYVSQHRKAFVDFINNDFYKQILKMSDKEDRLNVYQVLVREYLSIDTVIIGI